MSILGIDEVGRGPWAGPLVIGACILPKDSAGHYPAWVEPLTDSKKLSAKKREEYSAIILDNALATGLGWVPANEIDDIGLSAALKLATRRAIEEIKSQKVAFSEIIIDGTVNFLQGTALENYVTNLKKADYLIKEVSAASIIAKVARDNYMIKLSERYPGYGFEKHVGYGTAAHKRALETLGPCPEHRRSVRPVSGWSSLASRAGCGPHEGALAQAAQTWAGPTRPHKSELGRHNVTTKQLGDKAENIIADYLRSRGHSIVARNHKTKFYEIDIVSTKDDKIYFTEVKYRKNQSRGTSLDMITKQKYAQMTFAAESFLKLYPELKESYSPLLAAGLVSGPSFAIDDWLVLEQ